MYSYYVCGVCIQSVIQLPELVETNEKAEVVIRWGKIKDTSEGRSENGNGFIANPDSVCLFWKDVGAFLIRGGTEIVVDPAPMVEEQVLRLFLLGRVLGTLLHLRGLLVLHASAVMVNERAIAFMGGKGWGKSTLAGAMYEEGHSIVADDVVAVKMDSSGMAMVFPGFPQLKLWPEAATFLGHNVEALPRLHPEYDKRARIASRGFSSTPLPLHAIYVLDEGGQLEVTALNPSEAFLELVRHSYAAALLEATGTAALHFRVCDQLVRSVSISRLKRTYSLSDLRLATTLLADENKTQAGVNNHATVGTR